MLPNPYIEEETIGSVTIKKLKKPLVDINNNLNAKPKKSSKKCSKKPSYTTKKRPERKKIDKRNNKTLKEKKENILKTDLFVDHEVDDNLSLRDSSQVDNKKLFNCNNDYNFNFQTNTVFENLIFGNQSSLSSVENIQSDLEEECDFICIDLDKIPKLHQFIHLYDEDFKQKVISKSRRTSLFAACTKYNLHKFTIKKWIKEMDNKIINVERKKVNKRLLTWIMEEYFINNRRVSKQEIMLKARNIRSTRKLKIDDKWFIQLLAKYSELYDKIDHNNFD